jgi:2-methylcitrate dehydratase PrpD
MAEQGVTRTLATFAVETRLGDVSAAGVESAKVSVLDTIGVGFAALPLPIGRIITEHVASLGGQPEARVLGTSIRTSAPLAGLANGTLTHGIDYDGDAHVSTYCLPAALAIGEARRLSGKQVLEGYIVARECATRTVDAIEAQRKRGGGPTYRGSYRVGVGGPIGGAIAAGKLLGLDVDQMSRAIGIAASSAMGLRRNQGTMTKALHAGNGAQNGIQAALLAQRGFTGDPDILEAPLGLFNLLCLPGECDPEAVLSRLGKPFEMERGHQLKTFPSCHPSHMPLAALLQLKREHGFGPDDVETVESDFHTFSLFRTDPQEALAGGFGLPYMLAVAIIDGNMTVDALSDERIHDPRVRELMGRMRATEPVPDGSPERVTVKLRDGRSVSTEIAHAPHLERQDDIDAKFDDCAGRVLPAAAVRQLHDQLLGLDGIADVNELALAAA